MARAIYDKHVGCSLLGDENKFLAIYLSQKEKSFPENEEVLVICYRSLSYHVTILWPYISAAFGHCLVLQ